jgi:hypothetical protein
LHTDIFYYNNKHEAIFHPGDELWNQDRPNPHCLYWIFLSGMWVSFPRPDEWWSEALMTFQKVSPQFFQGYDPNNG